MSVQAMMGGKDGIAFLGGDMGFYHRLLASHLPAEFGKLILTFLIAFAAGWFFLKVRAPAPFLMGSLFGVWVFGGLVRPLRRHLGVTKWVYVPVILGLGVMIGENFKAGILEQAGHWSLTVTAMVLTTLLVSLLGYFFLNRRCGYLLARLCRLPMPHLLGPMGLSMLGHGAGWIELLRILFRLRQQ